MDINYSIHSYGYAVFLYLSVLSNYFIVTLIRAYRMHVFVQVPFKVEIWHLLTGLHTLFMILYFAAHVQAIIAILQEFSQTNCN